MNRFLLMPLTYSKFLDCQPEIFTFFEITTFSRLFFCFCSYQITTTDSIGRPAMPFAVKQRMSNGSIHVFIAESHRVEGKGSRLREKTEEAFADQKGVHPPHGHG